MNTNFIPKQSYSIFYLEGKISNKLNIYIIQINYPKIVYLLKKLN